MTLLEQGMTVYLDTIKVDLMGCQLVTIHL
jgi:hypothetical protein